MNKYSLYTEGYTTMKKFVSLLLALMMALSLVACGSLRYTGISSDAVNSSPFSAFLKAAKATFDAF